MATANLRPLSMLSNLIFCSIALTSAAAGRIKQVLAIVADGTSSNARKLKS
jgi:hypothetical protein